jgi:peptide chain release factor subunit 3
MGDGSWENYGDPTRQFQFNPAAQTWQPPSQYGAGQYGSGQYPDQYGQQQPGYQQQQQYYGAPQAPAYQQPPPPQSWAPQPGTQRPYQPPGQPFAPGQPSRPYAPPAPAKPYAPPGPSVPPPLPTQPPRVVPPEPSNEGSGPGGGGIGAYQPPSQRLPPPAGVPQPQGGKGNKGKPGGSTKGQVITIPRPMAQPDSAPKPAAAPAQDAPKASKVLSLSSKPAASAPKPAPKAGKVLSLSSTPAPPPETKAPAKPSPVSDTAAGEADDWEAEAEKEASSPVAAQSSPEEPQEEAPPPPPQGSPTEATEPAKAPAKAEEEPPEEKKKVVPAKKKKEMVRDPRPHLNIVFIGHVDAGKSTISGHILYATGMVDDRTLEKFEREAKQKNRESWKYAWAMDIGDDERDKGKTHETGSGYFETKNRRYTILDAPGHKAFVPSMIGGACQADIGILVISARKGEFETGFEKGGQTREHAVLVKTAGVRFLVIVINKMDDPSVNWDKARYDDILDKLNPFLKVTGYQKGSYEFLPISGLGGVNLSERIPEGVCPWYDGPCLLEKLDSIAFAELSADEPLRFPVQGKFKEMGLVVHGTNVSGAFSVGDKLTICPTKREVVVEEILHETESIPHCFPGDSVQLRLKGMDDEDIHVGFVLCQPGRLVGITKIFTAQLLILECKNIISGGYQCVLHLHAIVEECSIRSLLCTLDKKTGKILNKYPPFVKGGETVLVRIEVPNAIALEPFKVASKLGRFVLRDEGKTIAVGVVTKIVDKEDD